MKLHFPNWAENSRGDPRRMARRCAVLFTTLCMSGLMAGPLLAQGDGGHGRSGHSGGGHAGGGGGGGQVGGGRVGGGPIGGGHNISPGGAAHVGGGFSPGFAPGAVNRGGFSQPGFNRGPVGPIGGGPVVTAPPRIATTPSRIVTAPPYVRTAPFRVATTPPRTVRTPSPVMTAPPHVAAVPSRVAHSGTIFGSSGRSSAASFATRAPTLALNNGPGPTRDFSRWTSGHASAPHSSSVLATSGGHSAWTPVGTHAGGTTHSTFGDAGHHFDAGHWSSGHFGDVHHFGALQHDDHHGLFDHHDFHPLYFAGLGLGLGWGWRSYSYYPSFYYDYPYYSTPSYYEAPVYPSTTSPPVYDPTTAPASYVTPLPGETSSAAQTRVPDGLIPRTELPSQEAPEALPEEKTHGPVRFTR